MSSYFTLIYYLDSIQDKNEIWKYVPTVSHIDFINKKADNQDHTFARIIVNVLVRQIDSLDLQIADNARQSIDYLFHSWLYNTKSFDMLADLHKNHKFDSTVFNSISDWVTSFVDNEEKKSHYNYIPNREQYNYYKKILINSIAATLLTDMRDHVYSDLRTCLFDMIPYFKYISQMIFKHYMYREIEQPKQMNNININKLLALCKDICPICLNLFEEKQIHITSCNHVFHFDCIQEWYKINKSCPMCKNVNQY